MLLVLSVWSSDQIQVYNDDSIHSRFNSLNPDICRAWMTLNALKVEENLITIFVLLVSTVFVANLEYYWALGREFHDQWSVALLGADEHKLEEWEEGDKAGAERGGRETSNSIGAILLLYKTRNTSQSSYVLCKTVNRKKPQNLILIIKLINASF